MIVFLCRYSDIFLYFVSYYNLVMKITFLSLTTVLIYVMRVKQPHCLTYDSQSDNFPYYKYLLPPCAVLALMFPSEYSLFEILWTFSIFLESVSILPQLFLLQKMKDVENLTSHYVFALGAYRALYILNWVYRFVDTGDFVLVSLLSALVQTALYADFFYYYIIAMRSGKHVVIPV
jgi:ER lumen protein retaining receptor